jgi:dihydroorotate dehydrogenase electron transfer subunit
MPHIIDGTIKTHQEAAPDHFRLVIHAPQIAKEAQAGQFCMLQVREGLFPFLRRPMSLERIFADSVSMLYKVVGEGTRLLSSVSQGQTINIQGPLGKPFPLDPASDRHILVAGGIGIAPFPGLADAIIQKLGKPPEVIIAARTERHLLCEKDFRQMGCKIHLATDDGSAGEKAFASEVLKRLAPGPGTTVYACGPMPMMKAAHNVCGECGVTCYASLEAEMACGDGVCLGCVVEANVEIESERMVRVCKDGPVFDSKLIQWENY